MRRRSGATRHTHSKKQRAFIVGEEVEPYVIGTGGLPWTTDTIAEVLPKGNVRGTLGWELHSDQVRRVIGSCINKKLRGFRK